MDRNLLSRLNYLVTDRFVKHVSENQWEPGDDPAEAFAGWFSTCEAAGVQALKGAEDFDPGGQVLEELVVVPDPSPVGKWLEMTHETAMKILAVGFP